MVRRDDPASTDATSTDLPFTDIGLGPHREGRSAPSRTTSRAGTGSGRMIALVGVAALALIAVFALGRGTTEDAAPTAPVLPTPELVVGDESARPEPTATPEPPTPTPVPPTLIDLIGEGEVLAELSFGNRSKAILWCRETVPGTRISSTLALLHVADSIQFGEQLVRYEEITKPWIPSGGRRGVVLETEGLGVGSGPAPDAELGPQLGISDGSRCESCAPISVELDGRASLVGSCMHGVPFGASIAYVVAAPTWPGQTPLALHADCGITELRVDGDRIAIDAEAPLVRGLHEARFPLPPMDLVAADGWLTATDLELLDWHCDVSRSTQLQSAHLLPTEPLRRLTSTPTASAIGDIGVHGATVVGLSPDQCSLLTRAWWDRPGEELGTGSPIADLLGVAPPEGQRDWFYTCNPQ